MRAVRVVLAIVFLAVTSGTSINACSWVVGYFYEVTALRGRVVGTDLGLLQEIRPLRQAFVRKHAELTLYIYQFPIRPKTHLHIVKTIRADDHGRFDFGTVPAGHYMLFIDGGGNLSDWFDVEIRSLPHPTDYVTIDISPVSPDCSGGHMFVVKTK